MSRFDGYLVPRPIYVICNKNGCTGNILPDWAILPPPVLPIFNPLHMTHPPIAFLPQSPVSFSTFKKVITFFFKTNQQLLNPPSSHREGVS